jgi:hypothetical protein
MVNLSFVREGAVKHPCVLDAFFVDLQLTTYDLLVRNWPKCRTFAAQSSPFQQATATMEGQHQQSYREVSALRRQRSRTLSWIRPMTIAAITGLSAGSAHAGLILSPLGGFTVFSSGDDDTAHLSLNSTYKFFGQDFGAVDVSTNGNLNFSGNSDFANVGFPDSTSGAMIAPLWDDFSLSGNSRIIEQQGNGFFAVTWKNVETFSVPGSRDTFQAVMFNKDRNFGGFNFQQGDIAFAYGPIGSQLSFDDNATVGVNNGNGSKSAGLPGSGQTLINSADLSKLDPVKTEFILLRFNGTGYDVTYQHTDSAVPEPATIGALSLGLVGLASRRRNRKR